MKSHLLRVTILTALLIPVYSHGSSAHSTKRDRTLLRAVEKGDFHRTVSLLKQGANPNARDKYDWPVLTTACAKAARQ